MLLDDRTLTDQAAQIEALLGEIETFPDPDLRARATEVVEGLLVLYGEGLTRILAVIASQGDAAAPIFDALTSDDLIRHVLLLHDLHPVPIEVRVADALEEVRPYLKSHGGNVELVGVEEGVARLRLQGSCHGCPSSTVTLKLAIEEAVWRAAPDLDGIDAEGVADAPAADGFIAIADLLKPGKPAQPIPSWSTVAPMSIGDGEIQTQLLSDTTILFCKLDGTYYAYVDGCSQCRESLKDGILNASALTCARCGTRYDVQHAGEGLDASSLRLQPVPLLVHGDSIRVAVGGA